MTEKSRNRQAAFLALEGDIEALIARLDQEKTDVTGALYLLLGQQADAAAIGRVGSAFDEIQTGLRKVRQKMRAFSRTTIDLQEPPA